MNLIDYTAWQLIRFGALMQAIIAGALSRYAQSSEERMELFAAAISGYFIYGTPPEQLPLEAVQRLLDQGRRLLAVIVATQAIIIVKIVNTPIPSILH